ncbi:MAG: hypothetical protein FWH01_10955 [Oscillospiraceae bacterium]|nr:hypothetical protein [Oscillospiraceae bacterium]
MTGRLTRGVMWDVKASYYLKRRPDRPFAHFLAGWAALMWGETDQAGMYFGESLDLDAGYAPAYMGIIGREIALGRFNKAASLLIKHTDKLKLAKPINRFRLAGAISACAMLLLKGSGHADSAGVLGGAINGGGSAGGFGSVGGGSVGGFGSVSGSAAPKGGRGIITSLQHFASDRFWRKLSAQRGGAPAEGLSLFLDLIRYIELLWRTPPGQAPSGRTPSGRGFSERVRLAGAIYAMPGLLDALRLVIISDAAEAVAAGKTGASDRAGSTLYGAAGIEYTFDAPSIFTKALLNSLFREKIFIGEVRGPRIILANLRIDARARHIDNVNKWLFLKLCHTMGRGGELETWTAQELEADGWWADPVVRSFLRT